MKKYIFFLISFFLFGSLHPKDYESETIPIGPYGKPNLNGVWQVMNRANFNLEAHSASAAMHLVEGPVVPIPHPDILALGAVGSVPGGLSVVEGNKIPYKRDALRKRDENRNDWLNRDPEIKCYLPGVPRATYMPYAFQIFHSEEAFFFAYEYAGATRNIYLEDPGEPPVDSWMGQSWGYWEENTFVVEAKGFNDQTWFDRSGNYHSDKLKVTERYTLLNPYLMDYEANIEDEEVFTRPWKIKMKLYKKVGDDAQLQQFKCVEFVEELIYGEWRAK
tara:strand:- start:2789 stop:3616 length:828 start_codon:yes stop_codon:yes gene_type:complete